MDLVKEYNIINNFFEKIVVYHVRVVAGFYSEVDAMTQTLQADLVGTNSLSLFARRIMRNLIILLISGCRFPGAE